MDLSIDIVEAIADWLGLSLFKMQVFLSWSALLLGFGLTAAGIFEVWRRWRSPVERLRRARAVDPFAHPFGDVPKLPAGSILQFNSALLAGGADQGSGGNGNTSQGAAAARLRGRERRAY